MLDVESFVALPYAKQLHVCCLAWLRNQSIAPFVDGKPDRRYFVCRASLQRFDRQTVKNITLMLSEATTAIPLHDLQHRADEFIRGRQLAAERAKAPSSKSYTIDVAKFLSR